MSIPFQATHTADDGRYYMVDECEWFYANDMGHWKRHWSGAPAGLKELAKKSWSGPEDGLPPVGLKCMHGEEVVEILAHRAFKGHEHDPLLVVFATANDVSFSSPCCFRQIVRAEQIAADNRETAIRELMDIAQVDCRVTAARLVDAGFKREVV